MIINLLQTQMRRYLWVSWKEPWTWESQNLVFTQMDRSPWFWGWRDYSQRLVGCLLSLRWDLPSCRHHVSSKQFYCNMSRSCFSHITLSLVDSIYDSVMLLIFISSPMPCDSDLTIQLIFTWIIKNQGQLTCSKANSLSLLQNMLIVQGF